MSSKRRASKRKSSEIDSELDMSNPKNWTKQKLITEINNTGIKVPHNLRVTALLQIFMENKTPQDNIQDIIPETAVSNEVIRTVTNENSTVEVEAAAAQALTAMASSGSVQSASYVQGLEHTYMFKALNILIQPIKCTQGSVVIQLQPLCQTVFLPRKGI